MSNLSVHSFKYMGIPVEYTLKRKKVKNINIHINEKCMITVSASERTPVGEIKSFVESKAEWIMRSMASIERYNLTKPDNEIYTGKKLYLLGRQYTAEIRQSDCKKIQVCGDTITIYTDDAGDTDKVKKLYADFLREKALEVFPAVLNDMYVKMKAEGIPEPVLKIRNMKTRWGTCNIKTDVITLNLQLIKTDIDCIRQVAAHELTHFIVHDHGSGFYSILEKYVPDWKELKKTMDTKYKDGI